MPGLNVVIAINIGGVSTHSLRVLPLVSYAEDAGRLHIMGHVRQRTFFEHLESLLDKVDDQTGFIHVKLLREAMVKDQHMLYHDAEWSDNCTICDEERDLT